MAKKKRVVADEGDYELVPEKNFHKLEHTIKEINESPFVSDPSVREMGTLLRGVNKSLLSFLDVLKVISDSASFDEKEKNLVHEELKPLVDEIAIIKNQNETINSNLQNLMSRIDDLHFKMQTLQQLSLPYASENPAPNLPPIQGGPQPPSMEHEQPISHNDFPVQNDQPAPDRSMQQNLPSQPESNSLPPPNFPPPPDQLNPQPVSDTVPPLEKPDKKKKFGLF